MAKNCAVVVDADMLEHADGNDPVVLAVFLAVIAQVKAHAVGQSRRGGTARRHLVLLDREGEPGYVGAAFAGKIERQTAPARADVEHLLPRADQQLCRDMALLIELRGIEILDPIVKIGAGILTVLVEKKLVQLVRQIVVVRYILPGARERVVLMNPPPQSERTVQQLRQHSLRHGLEIEDEQVDQIVEAAFLDRQRPIHKGFGQIETRSDDELPVQRRVVKPNGDARTRRRRDGVGPSAGVGYAEPANGDDSLEKTREQHRDETEEGTDIATIHEKKWQSKRKTFTAPIMRSQPVAAAAGGGATRRLRVRPRPRQPCAAGRCRAPASPPLRPIARHWR